MPYTAWVDKSEPDRHRDPNTYLLAAALIESGAIDAIRDQMRALLLPGQHKLHWHDESTERRIQIIELVADMNALHMIVVRAGRPGEHPERRRRKCLE